MKATERAGGPAVGNALGFFIVLWLIPKVTWLEEADESMAVAFMGTLCIHALMELRNFIDWLQTRNNNVTST